MNHELLLEQFERISEAPDALPLLRRFILNLAVRGKLVEQDPKDEPASRMLARIQSEQTRQKGLTMGEDVFAGTVRPDETPFVVPDSWLWVRLGTRLSLINGRAFKPSEWLSKGLPIVRIQNLNNESAPFNCCDESIVEPKHIINSGSFLISWSGTPGTSFGAFIWKRGKAALNQHIFSCFQRGEVYFDRFLQLAINGRLDEMIAKAHGGVGLQHITKGKLENLALPVPPPREQHRIVEKVDELMGLCDQMEAMQTKREGKRNRLVEASLHHINNGGSAERLREHVSFCLDHLPKLTTSPHHINQIRQTIFNLAIRGRLVSQDCNDAPAALFLGDRQLIQDSTTEPWELPAGWSWSSLDLIGETLGGGTPSKANPEFWKGSIPWVSPKDMKVDEIGDAQDHISLSAVEQSATRLIPKGCLLVVVRGMILAHSFPTAINTVPVTINQDMKAIVPFRADLIRFLLLLTKGLKPEVLRLVLRSTHGTCKLLTDDLFSMPIPIPPLAEQHRIVDKVKDLMGVCDGLGEQLNLAEEEREHLLEAVLAEALNGREQQSDALKKSYG